MTIANLSVWRPPAADQIAATSQRLGLGLTTEQIELFAAMAPGFADAYQDCARWWLQARPTPPAVDWRRSDDRWHAAAYRFELPGAQGGHLAGLSVAVKGTIQVAGVPMSAGSALVEGHVPDRSATVVTRGLAAGASFTANTRTDDLGLAISGDTAAGGPVLNPWSMRHTPWGSSAGAAALVAAGEVDAAIGVDQAGSVRAPGAGCQLVVLLPTRGVIPMTGVVGFTPIQDRIGVAARSVETVARLASALSGSDGLDLLQGPYTPAQDWTIGLSEDVKGLRIGVITESMDRHRNDPDVIADVQAQIGRLAALGATVRPVSLPAWPLARALAMLITVHEGVPGLFAGRLGSHPSQVVGDPRLARQFTRRLERKPEDLAATVQLSTAAAGDDGGHPAGFWLAVAKQLTAELTASITGLFRGPEAVDVLITPTVPSTPPAVPTDQMSPQRRLERALGAGITHTCVVNLVGLPAAQIPAGLVDGLPVGMQVIAARGREDLCLRIARALEPTAGWPPAPASHNGKR